MLRDCSPCDSPWHKAVLCLRLDTFLQAMCQLFEPNADGALLQNGLAYLTEPVSSGPDLPTSGTSPC